jgi:hypothetical protein
LLHPPPGRCDHGEQQFAVNASRSCAELAIVYHLRNEGWHGVWVNSFGPRELRSEWFPAPAARTLAETGAPAWAVEAFDRLRAANGGSLGGFFDVFAWREPGAVRFYEAKVGPDRIKPTQLRFAELALRFHRSERFMIIEVAGPSLRGAPGHMPRSACEAVERDMRRPTADQLRSNLKGLPGDCWSATQSTSPTWKARCRGWTPPGCLRADSTLKWDAAAPGLQAQAAISRDRGRSQQASRDRALPDLLWHLPAAIGPVLLAFCIALWAPVRRLRCHLP